MIIKNYSEGIVEFASSERIVIKDLKPKITYYLNKYQRSNQETCINKDRLFGQEKKYFQDKLLQMVQVQTMGNYP